MSAGYSPWFEKNPSLFKQQAGILESWGYKPADESSRKGQGIAFVGNSKNDPERQLVVAFPDAFPSAAPKVYDTPNSKLLSRHHRSDTRQLCLFGFNESRWGTNMTVADALKEAEELIAQFKDEGITSDGDAHPPEPITRAILYAKDTAILVPPPISMFSDFRTLKRLSGKFFGKYAFAGNPKQESSGRGIILRASFGNDTLMCAEPFTGYLGNKGRDICGDWLYLPEAPTQENLQEVLAACLRQVKLVKKANEYWIALIFSEESGHATEKRRVWLVARGNGNGGFDRIRTFPYIQQERSPRIPSLAGLEAKRITLVGCGSLGSKLVANLAASGVNCFRLVDYDYFEPYNSVRHELGVESFGLSKAKALLGRLYSLNPAVATNSEHFDFQVASVAPMVQEMQFYEMVQESDLVIDATAMPSVGDFINRLAFETRVPALFISITNGAWSGEIVRVIPGKTPCLKCWEEEYFEQKPPSAPAPTGETFAPGCDQPTFTGASYEVGVVADLAAAMAVETLLQRGEFGDDSLNYIRWSGRDHSGKIVFRTEILPTHFKEGCPFRET